jgi:hypothetical protein
MSSNYCHITRYITSSKGTQHSSWLRQVAGSIPHQIIGIFNWPSPSSRTIVLGSTQSLKEMSTMNLPADKGRPVRKADNLTAICELTVQKMWEPRGLTTLWASAACYRDSFTFSFLLRLVVSLTGRWRPVAYTPSGVFSSCCRSKTKFLVI